MTTTPIRRPSPRPRVSVEMPAHTTPHEAIQGLFTLERISGGATLINASKERASYLLSGLIGQQLDVLHFHGPNRQQAPFDVAEVTVKNILQTLMDPRLEDPSMRAAWETYHDGLLERYPAYSSVLGTNRLHGPTVDLPLNDGFYSVF